MHATVSLARLTAVALAATAVFAGVAHAAPRSFTLDIDGGALSLGETGLPVPDGVVVQGRVDDSGAITVPPTGLTFPPIGQGGLAATITALGAGTGTFNDATGGMLVNLPLRIGITAPGYPAGCAIGTAASPVVLALKTYGGNVPSPDTDAGISGSAFNRGTGAIRLTDPDPQLGAEDCGGKLASFLTLDWGIGLIGKLAIPEKQAPPANPGGGAPQTPAPAGPVTTGTAPSTTKPAVKKLTRLRLTAPAKQKGLRSRGAVLGIEVDQPAKAVISTSVKIAGVKKATKLAAIRRSLKTGRASVAAVFPKALRSRVQRALRAGKRVVVTFSVTATDASGTRITRSRQIRLAR